MNGLLAWPVAAFLRVGLLVTYGEGRFTVRQIRGFLEAGK